MNVDTGQWAAITAEVEQLRREAGRLRWFAGTVMDAVIDFRGYWAPEAARRKPGRRATARDQPRHLRAL